MNVFTEESGKVSSKRTMGIVIIMTMLLLFTYKEVKNLPILNLEIFISFLVTAGTLLGITIAKYFATDKPSINV